MTHSGTYAGLADQGLEVAVTYSNSIQNTSVKPYLITYGNCITGINENNESFEFSVFPNPSDGSFSITSSDKPANVKLIDVFGHKITLTKIDASTFSFTSAKAGIYIIRVSLINGLQAFEKLIVQ